jgi:hypothetical protein
MKIAFKFRNKCPKVANRQQTFCWELAQGKEYQLTLNNRLNQMYEDPIPGILQEKPTFHLT